MSNNVAADLIRALIQNMDGVSDDWESLAMIVEFGEGFFSASGYAYAPNGVILAVAASPRAVQPAADAYAGSYYQPGEALPVKLLVQFDRPSGRYNVTFEDTDETRWKVTPHNYKELREELRPRFD